MGMRSHAVDFVSMRNSLFLRAELGNVSRLLEPDF